MHDQKNRICFALFLVSIKGWNLPVSHLVCVQQKSSSLGISLPLIWIRTRSWFTHSVYGESEYPLLWLRVTVSLFLCFGIDFCISVAVWPFLSHSLLSTNAVSIIDKASNAERGKCFLWCMMLWWYHHLYWCITLTLLCNNTIELHSQYCCLLCGTHNIWETYDHPFIFI